MPARIGASTADEQPPCRARQLRELGKPTLQCPNQLSRPLASWLPPNRGHLNSNHALGTLVPVEEPSTASIPDPRRPRIEKPAERGTSSPTQHTNGAQLNGMRGRLVLTLVFACCLNVHDALRLGQAQNALVVPVNSAITFARCLL